MGIYVSSAKGVVMNNEGLNIDQNLSPNLDSNTRQQQPVGKDIGGSSKKPTIQVHHPPQNYLQPRVRHPNHNYMQPGTQQRPQRRPPYPSPKQESYPQHSSVSHRQRPGSDVSWELPYIYTGKY